jgi:hypothetical protein
MRSNMKNYQSFVNTAIIGAIASALLFDRLPAFHLELGSFGGVCALLAAITYLRQQWTSIGKTDDGAMAELSAAPPNKLVSVAASDAAMNIAPTFRRAEGIDANGRIGSTAAYTTDLLRNIMRTVKSAGVSEAPAVAMWLEVWTQRQHHHRHEYEVSEIVRRVCSESRDDSFEFVLATDGTFTIKRPARERPAHKHEVDVPQFEGTPEVAASNRVN